MQASSKTHEALRCALFLACCLEAGTPVSAAPADAALSSGAGAAADQADMAIELYALESAILRAEKLHAGGGAFADIAVEMTRVFASDAADRLAHHLKNAVASIAAPDTAGPIDAAHAQLRHPAMDTIAARRRIADAIIDADRYPL